MEKNEKAFDELDDIFWNKYDNIQKAFEENLSNYQLVIKYLKEVLAELERHFLNINSIIQDSFPKKTTKFNEIFHLLNSTIKFHFDNNQKFINYTLTNFEKFSAQLKQVSPIYSDFKQFAEMYSSHQKKFNKIKEKFIESASLVESKTIEKIQKKNEKQTDDNNIISKKLKKDVQDNLKKYQMSIEETNKKREEFISKQKKLIKLDIDLEQLNINLYYGTLNQFLSLIKDKTIAFVNNSLFIQYQKQLEGKNINKEIQDFFIAIKSNGKNDEKKSIVFEGYKTKLDYDKCTNHEEFNTYDETLSFINKNLKEVFDTETLEKEKTKGNLRDWIKKFFEFDEKNIEIDKSTIEQYYFKALKQPFTHKSFLKIVTDMRTSTHFNRNKQLINLLGETLKIILDEAKKNKDYWTAKNCLILSQTFYYMEKDTKIFSCEILKKNSWLNNYNFWSEFCFYMLDEELRKLVTQYPELNINDIYKNKPYPEKLSSKISNIIFSQLMTMISNILMFTNNNMFAIELIESLKEKYIYFPKNNIDILYQSVSTDENVIKKLLDEYNKKSFKKKLNKKNVDEIRNAPERMAFPHGMEKPGEKASNQKAKKKNPELNKKNGVK